MLDFMKWLFIKPIRVPMVYQVRSGGGRALSVFVSDDHDRVGRLLIRAQRKIEKEDVQNGRLLPIAIEETKHRGGKRSVEIAFDLKGAEMLHRILGRALKDARGRERGHKIGRQIMSFLYHHERVLDTAVESLE